MALCVEEGDSQEVDVALYEKATQQQQQMQKGGPEQQYAPGLAGVTAGLAGVYSASNGFYSHLNLPSQSHKPNCNSLLHPSNSAHLDLYHPHTHSPPTHSKHLHQHCSCLGSGTTGLHTQHAANCQCHLHSHAHSNGVQGGAVATKEANGCSNGAITELDVASAVQADLATSGVLPPPLVNVQANSVQVSIYPLPNATVPVVYQVQLKIKKTYQLVWQSPIHLPSAAQQHQLLTYTVPNLVPGTKYLFRVRACPVLASGAALGAAIDSDDDPDGLDEIISDVADEATGLGVYSQPSTATTLGTRPEGNAPHPPVLSNLQLAALKKKSDKAGGNKKQQQEGKKKPTTTASAGAPNTPLSGSQQAKAAASAQDSEEDKSSPVKPSASNGKHKKSDSPALDNDEVDTEAESLASTPKRSMTRDASSSDLHAQTAVSAPSTPSTSSAAAVAAASSSLAASGRKLSKKEEKEAKKAAEEERRRLEAESAQAKKLAEEVAYQAYILEKRLEADRVRMEEEQRELEKYAQLKQEQDNKRLASEKAQQQAEDQNGGRKRGGKKNQQQAAQNAPAATVSAPLLPTPTPPARGKSKQAAAAPVVAPVVPVAAAAAPILHIKLRPEAGSAAGGKNVAQATKDALLPTPASHEPAAAAAAADKKGGRKGRESKEAATANAAVVAPVSATKPAWSLPAPAIAPVLSVAHSTPPSKSRDSPAVPSAAQYSMPSPIIKASSKLPGAKAWTNVASPAASPAVQPMSSSPPLQLSSHSPTFVPTSVSAANAAAVNRHTHPQDSLLSEHLNRFDAAKPWQADQLLLYQQEQQRLRDQQEQHQLQMQQAQRQHDQLMRHHAQQQHSVSAPHDPTSRFQHIAAYTASHSLLSGVGGGSLHSSLASTVSDRGSSGLDSSSSLTSSGWPEDDHHDALDDLAHEIERERWQATDHAHVAAQWNNTANTTLTSAAPSSGLHFTPLSSLRSDSLPGFGSTGGSSVFMPPVVSSATRPPLPKSSVVNDYASRSSNDALGPALGSTASYQLQAQLASSNGGLGLNSFSTHGFPSTSGLSRAAPTFTPSSLGDEVEAVLPAPHAVAPSSISGHTRRPLPSSTREPAAPAVSAGLFSSFALPSFSSFSTNAFGAAPVTTSSASSLNTDWSVAHASAHSLVVDDSDADLFSAPRGSRGMQSSLHVSQDHDDVTLIPGNTFGGASSLGSSWLNGLSAQPSKPQPSMFSSAANDWPSHQ